MTEFVSTSTWDDVQARQRLAVEVQAFVYPDALVIDNTGSPEDS